MSGLTLNTIGPNKGSRKGKKRIGRGFGSTGRYSGRGVKGQKARSGVSGLKAKGFQRTLLATPKKRGFTSTKVKPATVNIAQLSTSFNESDEVSLESLVEKNLIGKRAKEVKILGQGTIGKKLVVKGCLFSESAGKKILAAGGSIL